MGISFLLIPFVFVNPKTVMKRYFMTLEQFILIALHSQNTFQCKVVSHISISTS